MERLRALPVFAGGPLAAVRARAQGAPQPRAGRTGSASRSRASGASRSPTIPGIRPGDAQETLLHELVHLHVGRQPGGHAWHGRVFKRTLAAGDARGLRDHAALRPRSTLHGTYAAALERRRLLSGEQLALELAG